MSTTWNTLESRTARLARCEDLGTEGGGEGVGWASFLYWA